MEGITPKTLNEKIRLKKCLQLRKYADGISDEKIKEIYEFLSIERNKIILTPQMLYFVDAQEKPVRAFVITATPEGEKYAKIELSNTFVVVPHRSSSSSGGCSSCGGCSSNNNNNNNNNG